MLDTLDRRKIYYINPLNKKVYTTENLPLGDNVRKHIEKTFPKISFSRVNDIEKAQFIDQLLYLGKEFDKCQHYHFKGWLRQFKEITGATNEQIKGFLAYCSEYKRSAIYNSVVMKKISETFKQWQDGKDNEGWYKSNYRIYDDIEIFIDELNVLCGGSLNYPIILNYGDDNYIKMKQNIENFN